jgi:glycosyltransferase involved in cell wall biosynthesis
MRLGIFPEGPVSFDGYRYLYSKGERKYIDDLAPCFSSVTICAYAFQPGQAEYATAAQAAFEGRNIEVLELPMCRRSGAGMPAKVWQLLGVAGTIARHFRRWDLLYLFLPGYPSAIAYLINRFAGRPYFVYLADDWEQASPILYRWSGRKLLYGLFAAVNRWLQRRIVQDAFMVITAGKQLREKFEGTGRPIYETIPRMTLSSRDVYDRADTCLGRPVHLLCVGDLRPDKGVQFLITAVRTLLEREGRDCTLSLAGTGVLRARLEELTTGLPEGRVRFLGYIAEQQVLLKLYREADIFVLPSLSEGFPRVIYEAMSQSLPVVATMVGGVPHLLKNEVDALLVPPSDVASLAKAVGRMIDDGALRRQMIRRGKEIVIPILHQMGERQVDTLLRKHLPAYSAWMAKRS